MARWARSSVQTSAHAASQDGVRHLAESPTCSLFTHQLFVALIDRAEKGTAHVHFPNVDTAFQYNLFPLNIFALIHFPGFNQTQDMSTDVRPSACSSPWCFVPPRSLKSYIHQLSLRSRRDDDSLKVFVCDLMSIDLCAAQASSVFCSSKTWPAWPPEGFGLDNRTCFVCTEGQQESNTADRTS